jgi:ParB family chromosome partitioning protein
MSHEDLAQRVGKSRAAVTNALRLLKLPEDVRDMVRDGELSEAHGRTLLGAPDAARMRALARRTLADKLSVRQLEAVVRRESKPDKAPEPDDKNANLRDLETRITRRLGARASVEHRGKGGRVVIHYADLDELDRLLDVFGA